MFTKWYHHSMENEVMLWRIMRLQKNIKRKRKVMGVYRKKCKNAICMPWQHTIKIVESL